MTDQELLNQQDELQNQAQQVIAGLDLINLLNTYGKTSLVGSVVHGIMTWPDIDIEVEVDEYQLEDMTAIALKMLENPQTVEVSLRDYRRDQNPNKPKGLYIGAKYELNQTRWKLDVWLLKAKHRQALNIEKELQQLTDEQKVAILTIKNQVWSHPEYRKSFTSMDIYTAVIQHQAVNLDQFKQYLRKTGREL